LFKILITGLIPALQLLCLCFLPRFPGLPALTVSIGIPVTVWRWHVINCHSAAPPLHANKTPSGLKPKHGMTGNRALSSGRVRPLVSLRFPCFVQANASRHRFLCSPLPDATRPFEKRSQAKGAFAETLKWIGAPNSAPGISG